MGDMRRCSSATPGALGLALVPGLGFGVCAPVFRVVVGGL